MTEVPRHHGRVQDPFTSSQEQRRRLVPDHPWFGAALLVGGLGATFAWAGDWPWTALAIVAALAGAALLVLWALRSRRA